MQDFRKLKVWQAAHELTLAVYRITSSFPHEERFGLSIQLRRASASVGANIAEGCGRGTQQDFRRFLHMAMGSASETEYQLLLARDLNYLEFALHSEIQSQVTSTKRMLASLIKKLGVEIEN